MGIGVVVDGVIRAIGKSRAASKTKVPEKPDRQALIDADKIGGMQRARSEDAVKAAVDKNLRAETSRYLLKKGKEAFRVLIARRPNSRDDCDTETQFI